MDVQCNRNAGLDALRIQPRLGGQEPHRTRSMRNLHDDRTMAYTLEPLEFASVGLGFTCSHRACPWSGRSRSGTSWRAWVVQSLQLASSGTTDIFPRGPGQGSGGLARGNKEKA